MKILIINKNYEHFLKKIAFQGNTHKQPKLLSAMIFKKFKKFSKRNNKF